jgi:threonine dehydrogenase-like Zn-dependent dehydrogenase
MTGNRGVDTAIEAVGIPATFELCEGIVAPGGTIANIGVHGTKVDLKHWAQDVSSDVALEIQSRCDIDGHDVPETLWDFVDSYAGHDRQLALRLV